MTDSRGDQAQQLLAQAERLLPTVMADAAAAGITADVAFTIDTDDYLRARVSYAPGQFTEYVWDPSPTPDARLLAVMAEAVQEVTMERDQTDCVVWPVCPRHDRGTHADVIDDVAVWRCNADSGHVLAPVGRLAGTKGFR